jgi:hypothetical protein
MWYNAALNKLQERDPGEGCYGSLLAERRQGWEEKPAGWTPPVPLDVMKIAKWEAVKAERDRLEAGGFEYLDRVFDSDPTSVIRLTVAVAAARTAIAAGQTGLSFAWTLADNTVATLTADEFIGLPLALAANADTLHQHARGLREQINAATTAEEISAIPDW